MSDNRQLLIDAAAGDKKARVLLLERNLNLVWFSYHKFVALARDHNMSIPEKEDLFQFACVSFLEQIKNYKAEFDTTLSTFIVKRLIWRMLSYTVAQQKVNTVSLSSSGPQTCNNITSASDELHWEDILKADFDEETQVIRFDLQAALDSLPGNERLLITKRYIQERTQSELAAELNYSRISIQRKELAALSHLRAILSGNSQYFASESPDSSEATIGLSAFCAIKPPIAASTGGALSLKTTKPLLNRLATKIRLKNVLRLKNALRLKQVKT
jgi:RNA polymerase sigma factor (sigma-70 family)